MNAPYIHWTTCWHCGTDALCVRTAVAPGVAANFLAHMVCHKCLKEAVTQIERANDSRDAAACKGFSEALSQLERVMELVRVDDAKPRHASEALHDDVPWVPGHYSPNYPKEPKLDPPRDPLFTEKVLGTVMGDAVSDRVQCAFCEKDLLRARSTGTALIAHALDECRLTMREQRDNVRRELQRTVQERDSAIEAHKRAFINESGGTIEAGRH